MARAESDAVKRSVTKIHSGPRQQRCYYLEIAKTAPRDGFDN
jgi:hypothetical protein